MAQVRLVFNYKCGRLKNFRSEVKKLALLNNCEFDCAVTKGFLFENGVIALTGEESRLLAIKKVLEEKYGMYL